MNASIKSISEQAEQILFQEQNSPLIEDQSLPAKFILEEQKEAGCSILFVP